MSETLQEPKQNELATVATREGIELAVAMPIITAFQPHFDAALKMVEETRGITVEDAADVDGIAAAKAAKNRLVKVRTGSNAVRVAQKEVYVRMGRAVDGIHKRILAITDPEEQRLEAAATTAERIQAERREKRKADREAALRIWCVDTQYIDLTMMPEQGYQKLLADSKAAFEARVAAEAKAEAARINAELERQAEQERVRAENERLKREAEEAGRLAAEERRKAQVEADRQASEAKARLDQMAAEAQAEREAAAEKAAEALKAAEQKLETARNAAAVALRKQGEEALAAAEKTRKEREAAEAVARKEREARERVEAELAAKRAEEERKAAEVEAAREAASRATDSEKLLDMAARLRAFPMPPVTSKSAEATVKKTREYLNNLATKIEESLNG